MGYDDVISRMGEFGKYQRKIYLVLLLPAITCAFHKMGGVFLAAKTDFRCLLPEEDPENATFLLSPDVANASIPWDYVNKRWSQCERYDTLLTNQYQASDGNSSILLPPAVVKCDVFVYDKSQYALTATTEWNLVCDRAWLRATGDALFMVGVALGSMIFGSLSDNYGRRITFFSALMTQLASGVLVAVSPEIFSYMIFRLVVGTTTSGVFLVAYVIALEMVGPKTRLAAGMGVQLFFTSGYIFTAGLAYFITNWRKLEIAFTLPTVAFLGYWWFIPESARWLLNQGRSQEAKDLLQKAASENGVKLSGPTLDSLLNDASDTKPELAQSSALDLIRYPNLRRKSLLLCFTWFIISGTYYGLSWNTSSLGGNEYINFGIAASVEIPAYLFLVFALDKWGRKIILCGCMLIAGTSLLCTLLVSNSIPWLMVTFAMFGKLAITSAYGTIYVFSAEQFPTAIRNVGLGVCSTSARIGGVLAPYINHMGERWMPLPFVIFGGCSLISGILSLLLPETLNAKLPESIEDGESFGKKIVKENEKWGDDEIVKPLTAASNKVA